MRRVCFGTAAVRFGPMCWWRGGRRAEEASDSGYYAGRRHILPRTKLGVAARDLPLRTHQSG